jgi:hypothetical protein
LETLAAPLFLGMMERQEPMMIKLLFLVVFLATPAGSFAQESEKPEEQEPSLVEIAKKERARRARLGKPLNVITNANLKDIKGMVSSSTASSSSPTENQGEIDAEPPEDRKRDAVEWENLFGEARQRLVSAIDRGEYLEVRVTELSASWVRVRTEDPDSTLEAEFTQQTQQIEQDLEGNQREIQAAREAIQALEREARLEGVLPGTIRQLLGDLP